MRPPCMGISRVSHVAARLPELYCCPSNFLGAFCEDCFLVHYEGGFSGVKFRGDSFLGQNFGGEDSSIMTMSEYEIATSMEAMRLNEGKANGDLEEFDAFDKGLSDRKVETKKHFLEHSWTFWFDNPNGKQKQATWGSSLRPVYTFNSVEAFWCMYNNVLQPSKLVPGADFHCFKAGIEPKWEDPKCALGGKWTAQTPRSGGKSLLDTYWLHTLLAMIGEQFDEGEDICGAVVSVRRAQDKIAIWTKTASNEAAQISIGKQWKDILDYNEKIGYVVHDDAKRQEKNAKNRYTV